MIWNNILRISTHWVPLIGVLKKKKSAWKYKV